MIFLRLKIFTSKRRFKKTPEIFDEEAFTLIEIIVVVGIIAVLFAISAVGMISAGRQSRLQNDAKTLQSDIREAANRSITVTNGLNSNLPAKVWVVRIPSGTTNTSYYFEDWISDTSSSSKTIRLDSGGEIFYYNSSDETLNLVFSAPFARFKAVEGNMGTGSTFWQMNYGQAKEMLPRDTGSTDFVSSNFQIYVQDSKNKIPINVDVGTGEASVCKLRPVSDASTACN